MSDARDQSQIYQDTKDISGWLLPEETVKLYELAQSHGDIILEVGTFRGRSAAVLNTGASVDPKRSNRQFYSVDIDPASGFHAYDVLSARGLQQHALFFHGNLQSFREKFPVTPTMAFIDGDHTYEGVLADLEELKTLLAPNTPVVFHDYLNTDTPGVGRAIDEWMDAGFATKVGDYGCSAFLTTTSKCSGVPRAISEQQFRQFHNEYLQRINVESFRSARSISKREKIAVAFPWLVPIVRGIKRTLGVPSSMP